MFWRHIWGHILFDDGGNNQRNKRCYCCRYNRCYDDVPSFSRFFRLLRYHFFDTIKRGHNPCQFFVCPCRYSIQKPQSIVQFTVCIFIVICSLLQSFDPVELRASATISQKRHSFLCRRYICFCFFAVCNSFCSRICKRVKHRYNN